jgi:hypothetical protein
MFMIFVIIRRFTIRKVTIREFTKRRFTKFFIGLRNVYDFRNNSKIYDT